MNALNGQHAIPNVAVDDHPDSPMADSPATPVNTATSVAVKINGDPPHDDEPFAIKIENAKLDASSTRPAVGTPLDPGAHPYLSLISPSCQRPPPDTIPIHPPNGTPPPSNGELLDDVRMAEQQQTTQETQESQDTPMDEDPAPPNGHVNGNGNGTTPASIPNGSSPTAVDNAHDFPMNEDDDAQPPPAKRARKSSDADMASAHVSIIPLTPIVVRPLAGVLIVHCCIPSASLVPSSSRRLLPLLPQCRPRPLSPATTLLSSLLSTLHHACRLSASISISLPLRLFAL